MIQRELDADQRLLLCCLLSSALLKHLSRLPQALGLQRKSDHPQILGWGKEKTSQRHSRSIAWGGFVSPLHPVGSFWVRAGRGLVTCVLGWVSPFFLCPWMSYSPFLCPWVSYSPPYFGFSHFLCPWIGNSHFFCPSMSYSLPQIGQSFFLLLLGWFFPIFLNLQIGYSHFFCP